jgi:hypothetical protein
MRMKAVLSISLMANVLFLIILLCYLLTPILDFIVINISFPRACEQWRKDGTDLQVCQLIPGSWPRTVR